MLAKSLLCFNFIFLSILQVAALFYFGTPGFLNLLNILSPSQSYYYWRNVTRYDYDYDYDPADCFFEVQGGAYKFCTANQKVSISSSIMLLMIQLLISRILFPGVSNFLNASVGNPLLHASGSTACHVPDDIPLLLTRAAGSALRFQPKRRRIGSFGGMQ
jgi:hypothetical protein